MSDREIEIAGEVKRETDKAILFYDGKIEVWLPKSRISDYGQTKDGKTTSVFIPEWLAEEKELI